MPVIARPATATVFDLCVVGAGPVGLSLALEAARTGLQVLLVEAGSATPANHSAASHGEDLAEVLDTHSHAPLNQITWQGIGGTSWLWGGRCVPFEPIDFEVRDFVAGSGWPLGTADVAPWQPRAAAYLDCGSADFRTDPLDGWDDGSIATSQRERWSRRRHVGLHLGAQVTAHPAIAVLPDAMVTGVAFDADGTAVDCLRARIGTETVPLRADAYVLACGGLATTRLLLSAQRSRPTLFGGATGPLGRYYMGHLTGSIAALQLTRPADFPDLAFGQDADGTHVRRRFTLTSREQQEQRLLNTAFYLGNLPFSDVRHRNGALSLFFLVAAAPLLGARLISAETRRRNATARHPRNWPAHLRNIARRPWRVVRDIAGIVRWRYLSSPRRSVFVLRADSGMYALRYHAEQVPNAASRITLNGTVAEDGLPRLEIDFRYSQQDVDSVLHAHEVLDDQLRASGYGQLIYTDPEEQRAASVKAQATDGYHQIGTTRMSADPADGVVDPDCRVHGVANLYVAGSGVFPTSGEANPTFMAVTLAVRLAHHLAGRQAPPGRGSG